MTEPTKIVETPEQLEEKTRKEKEERRGKERDAVRKIVDEAAAKHDELGKKWLKEDADEAAKKLKEQEERLKKETK